MPRTESRQQVGRWGEDLACAELVRQGMEVVDRNWRCALGEIDIVATEVGDRGVTLVFCEVKCRTGLGFGHPLEAITFAKCVRSGSWPRTGCASIGWRRGASGWTPSAWSWCRARSRR